MIFYFLFTLIFFFGASVFSFVNVLIYRVPRKISFVQGRSHCPHCDHTLSFVDMIPFFGYFFLGGKCRYCQSPISIRYALVELLGGVLAIGCVLQFYTLGNGMSLVYTMLVFSLLAILTAVALVDLDTMEIPNGFVISVGVLGLLTLIFPEPDLISKAIGFFVVSVPLLVITLVVPGAFGGGDIKMMAVVGIFLGWELTLFSLWVAVLFGGIYAIYLVTTKQKDKKEHFAFGPFLCVGITFALFLGKNMINLYLSLLI